MPQHEEIRTDGDSDRPFGELARSVVHDFQDFFRAEARLAIAELKEKAGKYARAGGFLAIAGLLGFFAFACITTTLIVALAIVLPLWLAALLIGVMYGLAAGGAFLLGRVALEDVDPVPQKTVQILRETLERVASRAR